MEDRKKIIMIIGLVLLILTIAGAVVMKIRQSHKTVQEPEAAVPSYRQEIPVSPGQDTAEEEGYVPDETLLFEAEELKDALGETEELSFQETDNAGQEENEQVKKALQAVYLIWNIKENRLKEECTEEMIKTASDLVAELPEGAIKNRLMEILRRAADEFAKRMQERLTVTPSASPTVIPSVTPISGMALPSSTPGIQTVTIQQTAGISPTPIPASYYAYPAGTASSTGQPLPYGQPYSAQQMVTPTKMPTVSPTPTPAPILYPHVGNSRKINGISVKDRSLYESLPESLRSVLDGLQTELEAGNGDVITIPDPGLDSEERMQLLQAVRDILLPYTEGSISVLQENGFLVFTNSDALRKEYWDNRSVQEGILRLAHQLVSSGTSEKEAVISFNRYICRLLDYDETAAHDVSGISVTEGKGTCRDFAYMFRDLCNAAGIACRCVFGTIGDSDQLHVWDCVCVDDKWYYCDPAWNDGGSDEFPFMFSEKLWPGRKEKVR